MSANIYYEQVKKMAGKEVSTGSPSRLWESLQEATKNPNAEEITLSPEHISLLEGLYIGSKDDGYKDLLKGIQKYGEIKVYREF